ncbi:hypothetical protein [Ornithinimicrobium cryptoxanthini]|uniref:Uncharacterized protein n=1 Tax=Ornithinimicrobium cryptoxanthini TaxID=2934161 RepID=A0ABY4YKY4_9MICO|nr:hypothetical protein [Ornithinimicrobium cryptoxanthini]USQ76797.1 hypothetical protein NF557_02375 [Ornithinimicrobium cryptoxanthini]
MNPVRSIDVVAWSNYEEPGYAFSRGLDHVSDSWPNFRLRSEDDITLADYLDDEDHSEDQVLSGDTERFRRSWVAHTLTLPFAFDLIPWIWSRQHPRWWVRIQYAEVIDQLRIESWEGGRPRRIIRINAETPWVIYGDPFAWEAPFWDGRQPQGGEFEGSPAPLTLATEAEQVDLTKLFVLKGGARGVAGGGLPREYDADLGTCEVRDGRVFWRGLKPTQRASEQAHHLPGSFVDKEGLAHIDLENANLTPDPSLATEEDDWPDVEGLFAAAMENLLGITSREDLGQDHWTGLLLGSQPLPQKDLTMTKAADPQLRTGPRVETKLNTNDAAPDQVRTDPLDPPTVLPVRLSAAEQDKIQSVAHANHIPVPTLIRTWILDRLDQEST